MALVRTTPSNEWEIVPITGQSRTIRNPRGLSGAWFAVNGKILAWNIGSWPGESFASCPSPIIVATSDGTQIWQVPGSVINSSAIAVSDDGRRVAFDGTYKPNGTGFLNTASNRQNWVTGLQTAEMTTNSVSLILPLKDSFDGTTMPEHIGWITWSPDGSKLAYDFREQIYIYNVQSKVTLPLVRGSNPTWSPDGKWIAFRSPESEAHIVDPQTTERRILIPQHKIIWGVHWSPDSQYVLFGQPRPRFVPLLDPSTQLVVYRIRDGANVTIYEFGGLEVASDFGFFWTKDSVKFLEAAKTPPTIMPCDQR